MTLLDSDADTLKIYPIDKIGHYIIPSIASISISKTNFLSNILDK